MDNGLQAYGSHTRFNALALRHYTLPGSNASSLDVLVAKPHQTSDVDGFLFTLGQRNNTAAVMTGSTLTNSPSPANSGGILAFAA